MDICLCFGYIPPQDSVYNKSHNTGYFEQLESGRKYSSLAKIVILGDINARCGHFTFMSSLGESLIDYALMSQDLFPLINNFIVHDFYSCSTHAPIQLDLIVNYVINDDNDDNENIRLSKLSWDNNK